MGEGGKCRRVRGRLQRGEGEGYQWGGQRTKIKPTMVRTSAILESHTLAALAAGRPAGRDLRKVRAAAATLRMPEMHSRAMAAWSMADCAEKAAPAPLAVREEDKQVVPVQT